MVLKKKPLIIERHKERTIAHLIIWPDCERRALTARGRFLWPLFVRQKASQFFSFLGHFVALFMSFFHCHFFPWASGPVSVSPACPTNLLITAVSRCPCNWTGGRTGGQRVINARISTKNWSKRRRKKKN